MALVAYDYGTDSEGSEEEPDTEADKLNAQIEVAKKISNGLSFSSEISDEDEDNIHEHPHPITNNKGVSEVEIYEQFVNTGASFYSEKSHKEEDDNQALKNSNSSMFDKLPPKKVILKNKLEVFDDRVEDFIPKAQIPRKIRDKVRISIPSLSDFDDLKNAEPLSKKLKSSSKGSGLLSLLPPVKCVPISNISFVPNILSQKNKTPKEEVRKVIKPLIPDSVRKNKVGAATNVQGDVSGDSDDDIDLPETFDEALWQKSCGKLTKKDIIEEESVGEEPPVINLAPEPVQPYAGLDNRAFKELVGKNSRIPRNIKLIDINEEALVADTDLWMTKSLTDPEFVPKASVEDPVDPTKRKKHHITYLAEQAKANEQELQTQWASSKFNRNQSRAKYGF